MVYRAEIPYGAYWSTPFAKWQGSFAHLHGIQFAAHVAKSELAKRAIAAAVFDFGVLGTTVPQKSAFHGLPWFMGMIGADKVGGPTINQACATGVRCLLAAAQEIEADLASTALVAACDRISNGPHLVYPNPSAPGGTASHENWVLDNFERDPVTDQGVRVPALLRDDLVGDLVGMEHGLGLAGEVVRVGQVEVRGDHRHVEVDAAVGQYRLLFQEDRGSR